MRGLGIVGRMEVLGVLGLWGGFLEASIRLPECGHE